MSTDSIAVPNLITDIMDKDIIFIEGSRTIDYALKKMLMYNKHEVIVVKNLNDLNYADNLLGLLTINHLSKLIRENIKFNQRVGDYLSKNIATVDADDNIKLAKSLMKKKGLDRLLVLDDKQVVGILSSIDILKYEHEDDDNIELQLKVILGNLQEAVCVINPQGIVTFWNHSSEKLYGIKREDIVGTHIKESFPNALLLKALKERRSYENLKHVPRDGADVVISAIPLYHKGKLIGAVSTDRDISEITNLYMELEREKSKVELLNREMKQITSNKYSFNNIIGKAKGLKHAMSIAQRVAKTDASVLITGESGTGKEVFSRAIHEESGRKGNFVPVNCSAIPANLLESELFGYVEGAFTGAHRKGRAGKFELANGGTLFLDEIGDMPLLMQAKLLRVLQDGIVYRVGSGKPIKVDARIIAATNRDLQDLMEKNKFREDLYYRLNVVSIVIPPLRERKEDIPDLINSFITEFSEKISKTKPQITSDAMKILIDYHWKGNIRELSNTIERLVILCKDNKIDVKDIPAEIIHSTNITPLVDINIDNSIDFKKTVETFEKNLILNALAATNGNKAQAAELLKLKRTTLYYKLDLYNIT